MAKHPIELQQHDWQSLDEHETLRVNCSHWKCDGKKKAFTITRTIDGCVYNCYRCGTSGAIFMGSSPQAAQRKLHYLKSKKKFKIDWPYNSTVFLPFDFIPMHSQDKSIPPQAYAWLYQHELNDDDMFKHNIGWTFRLQRVVFPIYQEEYRVGQFVSLIGWQGRDVFYDRNCELFKRGLLKHQPLKYYTEINTQIYQNKSINDKSLKYNNNKYNTIYYYIKRTIDTKISTLIIVEDILSAIKCSNKYPDCNIIALLKSDLSEDFIRHFGYYQQIYVWLDWDARIKSIKISKLLQSKGYDVNTVRTLKDPKAVPYKEMPIL